MSISEFLIQLDSRIARRDLLLHPFYQAWSRGELTLEDLADYAQDYYHHVSAFPRYLAAFARRLDKSELREVVLANLSDELGTRPTESHAAVWLQFAQGVGIAPTRKTIPSSSMKELMDFYEDVASSGSVEEALAAFYAYESQVPRVAGEKLRGLKEFYDADDRTCQYFSLHMTADVYHAKAWRIQLEKRIASPGIASRALAAATAASQALWDALDGIENRRLEKKRMFAFSSRPRPRPVAGE